MLDWLAVQLIESGWKLKELHRLILTSATWRQAAPVVAARAGREDVKVSFRLRPEANGSGVSLRRLDAESLRDAMLAVSGELDLRMGGAYVPTKADKDGQVVVDEKQDGARRRSIYLQQRRTAPVGILSAFDGPAHNPVCVQRVSSTVALQSLMLLNSEFVRLRARAFATRLLELGDERGGNDAKRVDQAFERAFARPAGPEERDAALDFLRDQALVYAGQPEANLRVWTDLCQMLLASNGFLYVD